MAELDFLLPFFSFQSLVSGLNWPNDERQWSQWGYARPFPIFFLLPSLLSLFRAYKVRMQENLRRYFFFFSFLSPFSFKPTKIAHFLKKCAAWREPLFSPFFLSSLPAVVSMEGTGGGGGPFFPPPLLSFPFAIHFSEFFFNG